MTTTVKTATPYRKGHDRRCACGSGLAKGSNPIAKRKRSTSEPATAASSAVCAAASPSVEAWASDESSVLGRGDWYAKLGYPMRSHA